MPPFAARLLAVSFLILTTGAAAPVTAQANPSPASETLMQNTENNNRMVVKAALDGWMAGNASAFQTLVSDDVQWTITGNSAAAGTTHGRAELMEKVLGPFGARFSQSSDRFRPRKIHGVYADGDVVVAHFDATGTANDGTLYENSYIWLLTMSEGKAVKATAFFDSIAFDALWQRVKPASS
jgi:uncharacterized protein